MRSAFFQFASSSIHFAASLEILRDESISGGENFYCIWGAQTKYPGRMSVELEKLQSGPPKNIINLIKHADNKVDITSEINFDVDWVDAMTAKLVAKINYINNVSMLQSINSDGINPGAALANEITTLTKNKDIELQKNTSLIELLTRSYLQVYSATNIFINKNKINQIYIYNGRFLHERAVWDAARAKNISVLLFETTRNHYFLRKEGFHSRTNNQRVMLEHWEKSNLPIEKRIEIGAKYFMELRNKLRPFVTETKKQLTISKPYFVYYSSSDDELIGFWDEWSEPLGEQLDCVKKLQEIFEAQSTYELVVRIHPNLKNKSQKQKQDWAQISSTNSSRVIQAEEKISSYELLENSVGSISFGSTIGLESAFALKPSLVIADCGYDLIGVVDKANSWAYISNWIKKGHKIGSDELNKRKNNACIRGFFVSTGGLDFKYTQLTDKGLGAWDAVMFDRMNMKFSKVSIISKKIINRIKFKKVTSIINK